MSVTTPTVVITNVYADDNRGGAAITEMAVRYARTVVPGCRVVLVAISPDRGTYAQSYRFTKVSSPDVEILPPVLDVRTQGRRGTVAGVLRSLLLLAAPRRVARSNLTARRIVEATLVMSKGGQAFRDVPARNLVSFYSTVLPLLVAQRTQRPTAVVATSIGPFTRSRLVRALASVVLRRVSVVLARGERSAAVARQLGVPSQQIVVVPDSVLAYGRPDPPLVSSMLERYELRSGRFIAATLSYVMDGPDLRDPVFRCYSELLHRSLDEGLVDNVAIVLQVHGGTSDLAVTAAFLERTADERFVLVDDDLSPAELMALYAGAAATIGGRLHSAIFSLVAGTPGFPVQIGDPKPEDVFAVVGRLGWVLHPLADTPEDMYRRLRQAISSHDSREDLADAMRSAEISALRIESALADVVRRNG